MIGVIVPFGRPPIKKMEELDEYLGQSDSKMSVCLITSLSLPELCGE